MDISVSSPLKVFLKNDLFSDVVLHVYKISSEDEERFKMDSLGEDLDDSECARKKRKCPGEALKQEGKICTETQTDICGLSTATPLPPYLSPSSNPCPSSTSSSSTNTPMEHEASVMIPLMADSTTLKEIGALSPTPIFSSLPGNLLSHHPSGAPPTPPTVPSTPPTPSDTSSSHSVAPSSDERVSISVTTTANVPPPLPPCPSLQSATALTPCSSSLSSNLTAHPSSPLPCSSSTPCPSDSTRPASPLPSSPFASCASTCTTSTTTSTCTNPTVTSSTCAVSTSTSTSTCTSSSSSTPATSSSSTAITRSSASSSSITKSTSPKPMISLNGHRCVLAAHSKFFYVMFSNGMKESFEKEVKVYVEDVQSFEKMFEYFYTGVIDFKNSNLLGLLELCIQFDVPRLSCDVSSYLSANITFGNAFEVFEFSRTRLEKNNALSVKSMEFVLGNFFHIFRGYPPSIRYLSHTSLKEILLSDKLNVSMEFYAFMALRYWAEHTNARECEIRELLPYIRFSQIDVDRLRNLVRPSKLGLVCPDLFKHYMDALEYHASAPDMQPMLGICEVWRRKRDYYRPSEFIQINWKFKWSGLTSWVYNWTHLQGYKLFATLGKHEDGTFGMYFVPSANEQKQFCLKAELKVYLYNEDTPPQLLCPELKLEPTIFKSDSKTPLNSIAKGWATKINPAMLVNDMIVMKIKARICES